MQWVKRDKETINVDITLQRRLKIEQHEAH